MSEVSGVRTSWLMLARKRLFARSARSAASRAASASARNLCSFPSALASASSASLRAVMSSIETSILSPTIVVLEITWIHLPLAPIATSSTAFTARPVSRALAAAPSRQAMLRRRISGSGYNRSVAWVTFFTSSVPNPNKSLHFLL